MAKKRNIELLHCGVCSKKTFNKYIQLVLNSYSLMIIIKIVNYLQKKIQFCKHIYLLKIGQIFLSRIIYL